MPRERSNPNHHDQAAARSICAGASHPAREPVRRRKELSMSTASHRAYSVIKREGKEDFWHNIGLVFPHGDGEGLVFCWRYFLSTARSFSDATRRTSPKKCSRRKASSSSRSSKRSSGATQLEPSV